MNDWSSLISENQAIFDNSKKVAGSPTGLPSYMPIRSGLVKTGGLSFWSTTTMFILILSSAMVLLGYHAVAISYKTINK